MANLSTFCIILIDFPNIKPSSSSFDKYYIIMADYLIFRGIRFICVLLKISDPVFMSETRVGSHFLFHLCPLGSGTILASARGDFLQTVTASSVKKCFRWRPPRSMSSGPYHGRGAPGSCVGKYHEPRCQVNGHFLK